MDMGTRCELASWRAFSPLSLIGSLWDPQRLADLEGQLSNPTKPLRSLTEQGSRRSEHLYADRQTADSGSPQGTGSDASKQRGRLSNPVQRRLSDGEVDDLVTRYKAGSTIETLAHQFGVHRTTVLTHLDRHGIPRRATRKLTDQMVTAAAQRYAGGETLAEIAEHLGVVSSTLTRELRLIGIPIRHRGRQASD